MLNFVPVSPKNLDGPLRVLVLGRISTEHQSLDNIDASCDYAEARLAQIYQGPSEIRRLGERGSGWKVNRRSIQEAEEEIQTGRWDLVITEDLSRAWRNPQYQFRLAQMCHDHRTRLICFNDGIDTADPNWETFLAAAVLVHAAVVPQTRERVRRTATHAFHNGGMVLKSLFGYRRLTPEEAQSGMFGPFGLRLAKVVTATPIIQEMRQRVLAAENYEHVARWLNDEGVAPGEYVTSNVWTGRLVAAFLRNPLLQGKRTFRDDKCEMVFATGAHRREENPNPEVKIVPELAHMSPEEQTELWTAMNAHAAPIAREGEHPRRGTARKDSYWPGQHLRCVICGAELYWGVRGVLKCRNVFPGRPRKCWNQVLVNAEQVRTKVLPLVLQEVREHPELLSRVVDAAWKEFQRTSAHGTRRIDQLESRLAEARRQQETVMDLLVQRPDSVAFLERLDRIEREVAEVTTALAAEQNVAQSAVSYQTREQLASQLDAVVLELSRTSYAFGALMRRMFPDFWLHPIQALDTPQVRPRLKLTMPPTVPEHEPRILVVDAFDAPRQILHARAASALSIQHSKKSTTEIAAMLGIDRKAYFLAKNYARLMEERGSTDPFIELTTMPEKASRWRADAQGGSGDASRLKRSGDISNDNEGAATEAA